jgi:hypothetical protein
MGVETSKVTIMADANFQLYGDSALGAVNETLTWTDFFAENSYGIGALIAVLAIACIFIFLASWIKHRF